MKLILKSALMGAMALVYSFAHAQQTQDQSATPSSVVQATPAQTAPAQTTPQKSMDYVVLENGKLMEYSNGKATEVKNDFPATNGDKISSAGLITMKNGTTRQLKEGDRFYKDGHVEAAGAPQNPKQDQK